jgi:Sec-independent protein translocase protein TatA
MDSILGIGLPELIVILLLAGLVMGPQRVRYVARKLGRLTADLQRTSRQLVRQLNNELDSLDREGDLKSLKQEMSELQKEVQSLRHQNLQKALLGQEPDNRSRLESKPTFKPVSSSGPAEETAPPASPLPKPLEVADDPDD